MAREPQETPKPRKQETGAVTGNDPNHLNYGRNTTAAEHAENMGKRGPVDHHARPDGRPNPDPAPTESPPSLIDAEGNVNMGDDIGVVAQKPTETP